MSINVEEVLGNEVVARAAAGLGRALPLLLSCSNRPLDTLASVAEAATGREGAEALRGLAELLHAAYLATSDEAAELAGVLAYAAALAVEADVSIAEQLREAARRLLRGDREGALALLVETVIPLLRVRPVRNDAGARAAALLVSYLLDVCGTVNTRVLADLGFPEALDRVALTREERG